MDWFWSDWFTEIVKAALYFCCGVLAMMLWVKHREEKEQADEWECMEQAIDEALTVANEAKAAVEMIKEGRNYD